MEKWEGNLQKLQHAELSPVKWIIKNILPEGLAIIGGKPKIGKSYLALLLALTKAGGITEFGFDPGEPGKVLYMALEDSHRRLKKRAGEIMSHLPNDTPWPNVDYALLWPVLDQKGLVQLEQRLKDDPELVMIIIDTLGRVKPTGEKSKALYQQDVEFLSKLQNLSTAYRVAIVFIHHSRKDESGDWVDDFSGTLGVAGTADTLLLLKRSRTEDMATLNCTGRDIDAEDYALKSNSKAWYLVGIAKDVIMSRERQEIVRLLSQRGPMTPREISECLGKSGSTVRKLLHHMIADDQIKQDGLARYCVEISPGDYVVYI